MPSTHSDEPVAPLPGQPEPLIARIEFEGNLLYASETIKIRMRNKEGRRLDRAMLDQDMEELHLYFKEVEVFTDDAPGGGIVLRFRVSENPLVVRILVRGAVEMKEGEIRGLMRTREGYPLSRYHLASDREDIVAAYKLRGFHFANVPEPQITVLPNGGRRIDLSIVEGPKVEVSNILFRGNISVAEKKLREVMQTEELTWIERITGGPPFRESTLREDIVAIKQLLVSEGFVDAEVVLDDLRFSDDRETVEIVVRIDEHQPYRIGNVNVKIERVEPNTVGYPTAQDLAFFTEERLRQMLGGVSGQRYSGKQLTEGIENVQKAYYERSYIDAQVATPVLRGRQGELVVDLDIAVREGPKYRLARIDFVGNEFTRDKVLRREVRTAPGGFVDRNELDRGVTRLRRLQYFDRVTMEVSDALGPDGKPVEGWKTAQYDVVESRTGQFTFGLSLATDGGIGGSIAYRKRNFDILRWPRSWADIEAGRAWTGGGQELNIMFAPSTEVSQFMISFREPHLFDSEVALDTSLFRRLAFREDYREDNIGYSVGLGRSLYRAQDDSASLRGRIGWRHEWVRLSNVSSSAVPGAFLFEGENELREVNASLSLRTVDDLTRTRWETSTALAGSLGGTFLGGNLDYFGISFRHSQMFVVHETEDGGKHRLTGRLGMSFAEPLEDTSEIPPYERFYAGGTSLRGFSYRGVGPKVNGNSTGGQWLAFASLEYEVPIAPKLFSVVGFIDSGTLATTIWDKDAGFWRVSVGFGLRIAIPMLTGEQPLALDFGFPLIYEDQDDRQLVSFSMGRSF